MQSAPGPAPGAQEPTGSGTSPQPGGGNGDFTVESENFESIHNHSAYAYIAYP